MQEFKSKVLVLRASRYSLTDDKTKAEVKGCKFTYVESLQGAMKQNSNGVDVMSGILPYEAYEAFSVVPGYYDVKYDISVSGRGQALLKPKTCVFCEAFNV